MFEKVLLLLTLNPAILTVCRCLSHLNCSFYSNESYVALLEFILLQLTFSFAVRLCKLTAIAFLDDFARQELIEPNKLSKPLVHENLATTTVITGPTERRKLEISISRCNNVFVCSNKKQTE